MARIGTSKLYDKVFQAAFSPGIHFVGKPHSEPYLALVQGVVSVIDKARALDDVLNLVLLTGDIVFEPDLPAEYYSPSSGSSTSGT